MTDLHRQKHLHLEYTLSAFIEAQLHCLVDETLALKVHSIPLKKCISHRCHRNSSFKCDFCKSRNEWSRDMSAPPVVSH